MKYAVVYSSRTGNTKFPAEVLKEALPEDECIYFGPPDEAALKAAVISSRL